MRSEGLSPSWLSLAAHQSEGLAAHPAERAHRSHGRTAQYRKGARGRPAARSRPEFGRSGFGVSRSAGPAVRGRAVRARDARHSGPGPSWSRVWVTQLQFARPMLFTATCPGTVTVICFRPDANPSTAATISGFSTVGVPRVPCRPERQARYEQPDRRTALRWIVRTVQGGIHIRLALTCTGDSFAKCSATIIRTPGMATIRTVRIGDGISH